MYLLLAFQPESPSTLSLINKSSYPAHPSLTPLSQSHLEMTTNESKHADAFLGKRFTKTLWKQMASQSSKYKDKISSLSAILFKLD